MEITNQKHKRLILRTNDQSNEMIRNLEAQETRNETLNLHDPNLRWWTGADLENILMCGTLYIYKILLYIYYNLNNNSIY